MRPLLVVYWFGVAGALIAGCASTPPEEDPVQIKLNDLDSRTTRIERVVSNQSLLEMAQRVDTLQSQVSVLRGRVDELEQANAALRKQQRDLYADLDRRVGQGSGGPPSGTAGGAGAPAPVQNDQTAYAQAFDALKAGKYPAAIAGFQQFLVAYPKSELADNAQYWQGEAYYATHDFQNAATAFRTVTERWPGSRKAPDAMLKLGFALFELKHFGEARTTLTEVTHRFPDSDAARLASERLRLLPTTGAAQDPGTATPPEASH
jgi:tol-pal system protein YbgF